MNHLEWLEQQMERAKENFEKAQNELLIWTEALKLAKEKGEEVSEEKVVSRRQRHKPTLLDDAAEILGEHGPLTLKDLMDLLEEEKARRTTEDSLAVSLYREKWRFGKNKEKRWYVITG